MNNACSTHTLTPIATTQPPQTNAYPESSRGFVQQPQADPLGVEDARHRRDDGLDRVAFGGVLHKTKGETSEERRRENGEQIDGFASE